MSKVTIDLGFAKLIAERNGDPNYNEIIVGLEKNDGTYFQDIAIIGQKYHYDNQFNIVQDKGINVLVFGDENDEGYTEEFEIKIYEEKENEQLD